MQTKPAFGIGRGLALLATVMAAYLAQHLIQQSSLAEYGPPRLFEWFPALSRQLNWRGWSPAAALWLYLAAALAFGFLAPVWNGLDDTVGARHISPLSGGRSGTDRRRWRRLLATAAALCLLSTFVFRVSPARTPLGYLFWYGAAAAYLWAGVHRALQSTGGVAGMGERLDRSPLRGWPWLLGLLGAATVAYTVRWLGAPSRIDTLTAQVGLYTQAGAASGPWIAAGRAPVPGIALWVSTFWAGLAGDGLVGVRMAGLIAGLLLTVAVWLLAAELFRQPPRNGEGDASSEQSLFVTAVATGVAAFGIPVLLFARSPVLLEGVAWGSLGIWALLYGIRTGILPLVGGSAVLLGISALYGPNGLALICVGLAAWAGVFVLKPGWSRRANGAGEPGLPRFELLYWLGGAALMLLPLLAYLGAHGGTGAYLALNAALDGARTSLFTALGGRPALALGVAASDLQGAVIAPSTASGSGGLLGLNAPMLSTLIAPLYVLGLGALILNSDTFTGWVLAGWIIAGAAVSVLLAQPMAPHWSSLLVLWPAAAMAAAFAMERMRVALIECAGGWTRQASLYLAGGVVAAAAVLGWLSFYESALTDAGAASAAGRLLRRAAETENATALVSASSWSDDDIAVMAFLAGLSVDEVQRMVVEAGSLPASFILRTELLVSGDEPGLLQELQARYPGGELRITRDIHGNPAAYAYTVDN